MATIAFIDMNAHAAAMPWYRTNPREPIGSGRVLQVSQAVPLSPASLDGLLDAILRSARAGDNIIIVGHGRELGLAMPLLPRSRTRARAEIVALLAADRETGGSLPMPARSSAEVARSCGIPPIQVDQLRAKMNRVRALRLQHVALRACNTGGWPDALRKYKPFFGATEVSAPDRRDVYGTLNPGGLVANMDAWVSRHSRGHIYVEGVAPDRVAIQTEGGATEDHAYSIAVESLRGLNAWAARNHIAGTGTGTRLYHGQFLTRGLPNQPRIVFCGTTDYANHIVVV